MDPQIVTRYHNLASNPFTPATAEEDYYQTIQTQRILQELHFGIVSRKGFLLLLGEVGVGKTSLLLQLLGRLHQEQGLHTAWVFNTSIDRQDLLKAIIADFGLEVPASASQSELLQILHSHFLEVNEDGGNCAVVVDEAHNLSEEALESLRMLSNLEAKGNKLVQILLAGQEELKELLNTQRLRQLQSRIYLQCTLRPLDRREILPYCSFKLSRAGTRLPFSRGAVRLLWQASRGNTRTLDLVMDRALHAMAARETHTVSGGIVRRALRELAPQQRLIHQNLARSRKRTTTGLLAAAAVLLVAAGTYLSGFAGPLSGSDHLGSPRLFSGSSGSSGDSKGLPSANRTSPRIRGKASSGTQSHPDGERPRKILKFLNSFNIVDKLADLQQSVDQGDIGPFRRSLPSSLRLAGLDELPEGSRLRFAALPWRKLTGKGPEWYVLWDPVLELDLDQPSASSPSDIVILQTILREKGLYTYRVDGKYGPRTRRALAAYQEMRMTDPAQGLNERTLFSLCRDLRGNNSTVPENS
jgi:type II secretory pathway predicted ATPase ExeA